MKKITAILILLLCGISLLHAQVTIGSGHSPSPGALLDLKTDSSDNLITATKGLGLPRVNLSKADQLYPMFENDADYNDSSKPKKATEDINHVGLVLQMIMC